MGSYVGPHGSESCRPNPSMDRAETKAPPFYVPLGAQKSSQKEAGGARPKRLICDRVHTRAEPSDGPETTGDYTASEVFCTRTWTCT